MTDANKPRGWRPIDGAQIKDDWMLGWDGDSIHVVCRRDDGLFVVVLDNENHELTLAEWQLTHLRPLPAPPRQKK